VVINISILIIAGIGDYIRQLFRDILPAVAKPARYTGNEVNMIKKIGAEQGENGLAFPDVYEWACPIWEEKYCMAWSMKKASIYWKEFLLPGPIMEAVMRAGKDFALCARILRPLHVIYIIGFSLQYELVN
jgi:hypothetical protein